MAWGAGESVGAGVVRSGVGTLASPVGEVWQRVPHLPTPLNRPLPWVDDFLLLGLSVSLNDF